MAASTKQIGRHRRSQGERSAATTAALMDAARALFAQEGFVGTSLEAVAANAGVTKGALYHHFDNKRELFRAVYAREEEQLVHHSFVAAARAPDAWEGFEAGLVAYFEAASDPAVQRITLLDAPSVLGWDEWYGIAISGWSMLIEGGLARAIEAGELDARPLKPLVSLLYGAICQAAMTVARSENQDEDKAAFLSELRALVRGLAHRS